MEFSIHSLTKDLIRLKISDFIKLAENNISDEYWKEENFLSDLPRKWDLSCYVMQNGNTTAGFLIASEKESGVHIHKFVVDAPLQRHGLGKQMLQWLLAKTDSPLTLKVQKNNVTAMAFYKKNGFTIRESGANAHLMIRE